jgi:hypothetical protein
MRFNLPPLNDPTRINIPVSASARIRFEPNSRDAINSRIWDSIKYDTKSPNSAEIVASSNPIVQDMNPLSARIANQNYIQQAQFFPDQPKIQSKKETSQYISPTPINPGLTNNPYLQRLDAQHDGRNFLREMRSAVYEDNIDREIESSKLLTDRQFTHRFLPEQEQAHLASIKAYELLRPKTDDYQKSFR